MRKTIIALLLLVLPCAALAREKDPDSARGSKSESIAPKYEYCYEYFESHIDKYVVDGKEQMAKGNCYYAYQAFKRIAFNAATPPSACKKSVRWYELVQDRIDYSRVMVSELSKSCPQVAGDSSATTEGSAEIIKERDGSLRIQKKKP